MKDERNNPQRNTIDITRDLARLVEANTKGAHLAFKTLGRGGCFKPLHPPCTHPSCMPVPK
jgi:hypothetical protein